jgi:hypothetical protein
MTGRGGKVCVTLSRIESQKAKVVVADEITNLHRDQKLGLLFRDEVSLKGKTAFVRLAGNPDLAVNEYFSNGNPSVYVRIKDLGLGMLLWMSHFFPREPWAMSIRQRSLAALEEVDQPVEAPRSVVVLNDEANEDLVLQREAAACEISERSVYRLVDEQVPGCRREKDHDEERREQLGLKREAAQGVLHVSSPLANRYPTPNTVRM